MLYEVPLTEPALLLMLYEVPLTEPALLLILYEVPLTESALLLMHLLHLRLSCLSEGCIEPRSAFLAMFASYSRAPPDSIIGPEVGYPKDFRCFPPVVSVSF
jgi:hypothetical protein